MSLTAQRQPLSVRSQQTLAEALFEEGYEYVAGKLEDIYAQSGQISSLDIDELRSLSNYCGHGNDSDRIKEILSGKSPGARYIGYRIVENPEMSLEQACSDWAAYKSIRSWMEQQDRNWLATMDLAELRSYPNPEQHPWFDGVPKEWKVFPGRLMGLGIRFGWQAQRFCDLYQHFAVKGRSWRSCYQANQNKIKELALTPNYNRLPLWVKKEMINSSQKIETQRIGNIWRFLPCAKAWKWCPSLPKGIAEKVGKLSPKMRLLAKIAYESCGWRVTKEDFWLALSRLEKLTLGQLLSEQDEWYSYFALRLIEAYTGIPYGFIDQPEAKEIRLTECLELVAAHGNPKTVCQNVFGTAGKATIKAFSECTSPNAWKWAMHLATGNPDLLQKYFKLKAPLDFQVEALEFLRQLSPEAALRMVGTTTFRMRGEDKPVEDFLVRDTGYLWNNIQTKPDLGRVRCWLSVHEELARRFIAEQPDEVLPVPSKWQPLQGLCDVNGEWEIELPTCTATLKLWGEQLHHCVGGYGPKIKSGDCVILAVRIAGIVRYTIEMVNGRCQQFYGERNSSPGRALYSSVMEAIYQAI